MAKKIQFDVEAREGLKKGVDALANAEEVMVCNSLMAIVPVMSLFNPITGKTFRYKAQQSKRLQTMLQRLTSSKATKV